MTVWQIEVLTPRGWVRMKPRYRDRKVASSWVSFVKAAWHANHGRTVKVKTEAAKEPTP
jgi:hypothetical protein